jgi:hypothetical protein
MIDFVIILCLIGLCALAISFALFSILVIEEDKEDERDDNRSS